MAAGEVKCKLWFQALAVGIYAATNPL